MRKADMIETAVERGTELLQFVESGRSYWESDSWAEIWWGERRYVNILKEACSGQRRQQGLNPEVRAWQTRGAEGSSGWSLVGAAGREELEVCLQTASGSQGGIPFLPESHGRGFNQGEVTFVSSFEYRVENGVDGARMEERNEGRLFNVPMRGTWEESVEMERRGQVRLRVGGRINRTGWCAWRRGEVGPSRKWWA